MISADTLPHPSLGNVAESDVHSLFIDQISEGSSKSGNNTERAAMNFRSPDNLRELDDINIPMHENLSQTFPRQSTSRINLPMEGENDISAGR